MTEAGERWVREPVFRYLEPDESWWHVFPSKYSALAFNPVSTARFALVGSGRGMYYVGETAAVALWETVLRDAFPNSDGSVWLSPAKYADMSIARVSGARRFALLSLEGARMRQWAAAQRFDELVELTRVRPAQYPRTHDAAHRLRSEVPDADGLLWLSRQVDREAVGVVYQRDDAGAADFTVTGLVPLASAEGVALIDAALDAHGYFRLPQDDPALEATLPDDEAP
ncbi:MAG TPA: RES family NAD+ phosphorylase [Tahibacter sp.]|nr:RES family NAD+ phosphorylase [Tahibacter sp.]